MTTLQYVKHRKKQKCKFQVQPIDSQLYSKLGQVLSKSRDERQLMEGLKAEAVLLPPEELDFMF